MLPAGQPLSADLPQAAADLLRHDDGCRRPASSPSRCSGSISRAVAGRRRSRPRSCSSKAARRRTADAARAHRPVAQRRIGASRSKRSSGRSTRRCAISSGSSTCCASIRSAPPKASPDYLAALGRQHTPELWLTEFAINGGTRALELDGPQHARRARAGVSCSAWAASPRSRGSGSTGSRSSATTRAPRSTFQRDEQGRGLAKSARPSRGEQRMKERIDKLVQTSIGSACASGCSCSPRCSRC